MAPKSFFLSLLLGLLLVFAGGNAAAQLADEPRDADEEDFATGVSNGTGTEDSDPIVGVRLDRPRHAGRGCPPGTITSQLSPDAKSLTLFFDNYVVESGSSPNRRDVSNCEVLVPIQVPAGFRMMVGRIDYRGFASAPKQGRSVLRTQTQILNENGAAVTRPLKRRRVFQGPVQQNFTVSSRVQAAPEWSRCGENFQLRVRTDLIAVSNRQGEPSLAALDTIDQSARAQYHIRWKKCDDPRIRPDRPQPPGRPDRPVRPQPPGRPNRR